MRDICTKNSNALRKMIENCSTVRWAGGESPWCGGPLDNCYIYFRGRYLTFAEEPGYASAELVEPNEFLDLVAEAMPRKQPDPKSTDIICTENTPELRQMIEDCSEVEWAGDGLPPLTFEKFLYFGYRRETLTHSSDTSYGRYVEPNKFLTVCVKAKPKNTNSQQIEELKKTIDKAQQQIEELKKSNKKQKG